MRDLYELDQDGAIQEALDTVAGDTRADFLRKAAVASGGLLGGGAAFAILAKPASAATESDVNIANFALTLEYLEAEFYTQAENGGALQDELAGFARVVGAHERAHVKALQGLLGNAAVKKPRFNFRGTTEDAKAFGKTAQVLEDTGVAAYKGAAPLIDHVDVLKPALAIHTVEARHAAWIRHILGTPPAPEAFDQPKSMSEILAAVGETRFIASPLMTMRGMSPSFTG